MALSKMDVYIFVFLCAGLMSTILGLKPIGQESKNPPPDPATCANYPGFQLYRNKHVQMCLKFIKFQNSSQNAPAQYRCGHEGSLIATFESKEKLEILQQQKRCVWVDFEQTASGANYFVFGRLTYEVRYDEQKHKDLFYQGSPRYINSKDWITISVYRDLCGFYHPKYRLLAMEYCDFPGRRYRNCNFGVVCEKWEYTLD
ncbi:hypothetical protein BgiMline_006876 [Biomphalaria glabrata]|nr:hypothetical protein BgiMline_004738 [Biomphalaria glabrata]